MSGRLRCYKQQQRSKLLAQFVVKASAFHCYTHTKTSAPLPDYVDNACTDPVYPKLSWVVLGTQ